MNVWITIKGTQTVDEQSETLEMSTVGELSPEGEGWCLSYSESAATGMEGVETMLSIAPDRVVLTRSGAVHTQLILEQGRRHQCAYDTGYGLLQLGIFTRVVTAALSAAGGTVRFSYTLDQNGRAISAHEVELTVAAHKKG